MPDDTRPDIPEAVHSGASHWLARRQGSACAGDEDAFRRWLAADPMHEEAYREAERLWRHSRLLGDFPSARTRKLGKAPLLMRRKVQAAMAGCAAVLVLGFVSTQFTRLVPAFSIGTQVEAATLRTASGEIRSFTLSDGSRLILDADTVVQIAISGKARHAVLDHGRARFEIAAKDQLPFTVAASGGEVIAGEGRFDVSATGDGVRVTAIDRPVKMRPDGANAPAQVLAAGKQAELGPSAAATPAPRGQGQWVNGVLQLDNAPLGEAVAQINRYNATQVELRDPALARLPVSGAFEVHQPLRFARTVAAALDLSLDQQGPKLVLSAALRPEKK